MERTMFGDLDLPLNASSGFVSISWASCLASSNAPQLRCPNRFSRTIRQTTWFRGRMCLFRV